MCYSELLNMAIYFVDLSVNMMLFLSYVSLTEVYLPTMAPRRGFQPPASWKIFDSQCTSSGPHDQLLVRKMGHLCSAVRHSSWNVCRGPRCNPEPGSAAAQLLGSQTAGGISHNGRLPMPLAAVCFEIIEVPKDLMTLNAHNPVTPHLAAATVASLTMGSPFPHWTNISRENACFHVDLPRNPSIE